MIWDQDADAAMQQVPFFIRRKVKGQVENFVTDQGESRVTLAHVRSLKRSFLSKGGMEKQMKGYDLSTCFGGSGCPNAIGDISLMASDIQAIMARADILGFLKSRVKGDLKFHHELRISISGCPNACSRPQIADIGIIAMAVPGVTDSPCTHCGQCEAACPDDAVRLTDHGPQIDTQACLCCGKCVRECPAHTIETVETGFRMLLGGRLGRHPRLGMPVPALLTHRQVLDAVNRCIVFYKTHSQEGQRFSHLLDTPSRIFPNHDPADMYCPTDMY